MAIRKFENDRITILCPNCGKETAEKVDPEKIVFDEILKEYRNLAVDCKHCEADGRVMTVYVNMNLPEFDEMEIEVMEELAPPEEVEARRAVRDLMWKHRPDLKGKDRKKERENFVKKNDAKIKEKREKIQERKAARALENRNNG